MLKNEIFNFLEIGVFYGNSINMWNEYFKNANIHGIDTFKGVNGNGIPFADPMKYYYEIYTNKNKYPKINLIKLDQSNETELKMFVNYCKSNNTKFKVILDDGSHLMKDQQLSFFYLFQLLEEGGIYVIEDIHTSADNFGYDVLYNSANSTKKIFMDFDKSKKFECLYIDKYNSLLNINSEIDHIKFHTIYNSYNTSETLLIYKK